MKRKEISLNIDGEDMSFELKCADEQEVYITKALKSAVGDEYGQREALRLLEAEKDLSLIQFSDAGALKQYLRYSMGLPCLRLVKNNVCMLLVLKTDAERYVKHLKSARPSCTSAAAVKLEKINEQLRCKTAAEKRNNEKQVNSQADKEKIAQLVQEEMTPYLEGIYIDLKEIKNDIDSLKIEGVYDGTGNDYSDDASNA